LRISLNCSGFALTGTLTAEQVAEKTKTAVVAALPLDWSDSEAVCPFGKAV
jgi:hypothetical protein